MNENTAIGLDVDNRQINMVRLSNQDQNIKLVDFANVNFAGSISAAERLRQLRELAQVKGIASQAVNVGVSGESVIVRYIDFPKMKEQELSQALKYEAQQYIPFRIEEVVFDYQLLEPLTELKERMKVLLVAVKRETLTELIEFIRQAGLKPSLVDVHSFSLINCFQRSGPKMQEADVFALVNLKLGLVNINILQGKTPFFTRDISLLQDLSTLPQGKDEQALLFDALAPHLASLIREIRLSIDYFESEFEKQVRKIYLSGEGANIEQLIAFFNTQLDREIELWNPLQDLAVDSAQIDRETLNKSSSMLAIACGLALRGSK